MITSAVHEQQLIADKTALFVVKLKLQLTRMDLQRQQEQAAL